MTVQGTVRAAPGRPQADESIPVHHLRNLFCLPGQKRFLFYGWRIDSHLSGLYNTKYRNEELGGSAEHENNQ